MRWNSEFNRIYELNLEMQWNSKFKRINEIDLEMNWNSIGLDNEVELIHENYKEQLTE